jgi:hypothetical protein
LIETLTDRLQSEFAAFASNLDSSQFGLRANLVASQFESGLDSGSGENRMIKRGCHGANRENADLIPVNFHGHQNVMTLRSEQNSLVIQRFRKLRGWPKKGREMNTKVAAFAVLLLLGASVPARAKKIPPRPFFLQTPVTLNGAEIPQGLYDLTLESSKSEVRVTLWRDGRFVGTAPGAWVKNGAKYTEDSALLRVNSDGSRSLVEIRFAGAAKTIVLSRPDATIRVSAKK